MHDDRALTTGRLGRALPRIVAAVDELVDADLSVTGWHAPGEPVELAQAVEQRFSPMAIGEPWGRAWGTTWFHIRGQVAPDVAAGDLELIVDLGFSGGPGFSAEALVWLPDGTAVKGLHPLSKHISLHGISDIDVYVEGAANPDIAHDGAPTLQGDWESAGDTPLYRLAAVEVVRRHAEVAELRADLEVLGELMACLPNEQPRRWAIAAAIARALDRLDLVDATGIRATAGQARAELAAVLASPANGTSHRIAAVGHAHIDSAWLWPLRETVRKIARTVSNVCELAEHHPDLTFAFSSAQQHAWLKEFHPQIFARLTAAVAAGTIVPVGGMWVESDTNMVGAEAMCRQFVHGKRFFLDHYGIETDEVWLPDSFGYAAGLPQIVRQSNSRYFLTQKISWSETNKFPHHTFHWTGIDGSSVFTHFPSADTYNANMVVSELAHAEANFADKGRANSSLLPFGHGNGGGGPTREMLARLRRVGDLEGAPRTAMSTPQRFFAEAEAEYPDAPSWSGELYLELHRAVYTSQLRTKQGNRRSEHLLREAEIWCTTATVRTGVEYPQADLDRLWQRTLLHQFHDILPGSSIRWVHREAEQAYAEIQQELSEIVRTAQRAAAGEGDRTLTFNAAASTRHGVPSLGAAVAEQVGAVTVSAAGDGFTLSNGLLTVSIGVDGHLSSVVDHSTGDREVLAGPSNMLQLHPDLPRQWDAWDLDSNYRRVVTELDRADELTATADGVRMVRSFGGSTVVQTVTLEPGARRVDCSIEVDWHEREKLLKVAFDLDVQAESSAAETQFGHVRRPTHTNTSWEAARFEICAHRYLSLAEDGYGVALVNDSTYGHDVTRRPLPQGYGVVARLSLLRAPRYPDPEADRGLHRMRYALVVDPAPSAAVVEGMSINLPPREVSGAGPVSPLLAMDNPEVVVSALKLADRPLDDDGGPADVVVRLYQATGSRSRGRLTLGFEADSVQPVDLLERPLSGDLAAGQGLENITLVEGVVEVDLRPFQFVTLRIRRLPGSY